MRVEYLIIILLLAGCVSHNVSKLEPPHQVPGVAYGTIKCYQEATDTLNQTGIDGNCSLAYNGTYTEVLTYDEYTFDPQSYFIVNYTKPPRAVNTSVWQVSHGDVNSSSPFSNANPRPPYNITIPQTCWNASSTGLSFRFVTAAIIPDSGPLYPTWSYPECWNGTNYTFIGINYTMNASEPTISTVSPPTTKWRDGDWSTFSARNPGSITSWAKGDTQEFSGYIGDAEVFEEAMWWDIAPPNIYFVSPSPANGVNVYAYPLTFNFTSEFPVSRNGTFVQLDGVNKTPTFSDDNLSFWYTPTYTEHIYNHSFTVMAIGNLTNFTTPANPWDSNESRTFTYLACAPLTNSTGTFTLIHDINVTSGSDNCFEFPVGISSKIQDGGGYTIYGNSKAPGSAALHFNSSTSGNSTLGIIRNIQIRGFDYGIRSLNRLNSYLITNVTSAGNNYGIYIQNALSTNVTFSRLENNTLAGLIVPNNNTLSTIGTTNLSINSSTMRSNGQYGLQFIHDQSITFTGFNLSNLTVDNHTAAGISFTSINPFASPSDSFNVQGSVISNSGLYGLYSNTAYNSTIINNTIVNSTYGIYFDKAIGSVSGNIQSNATTHIDWVSASINTINFSSIIDNPRGTLLNYTNISLVGSNVKNDLNVSWCVIPAALPNGYRNFANKCINISDVHREDSDSPSISTATWTYVDGENLSANFSETGLRVLQYQGSWSEVSGTLNTTANTLTISSLGPASSNWTAYALVELIPTDSNLSIYNGTWIPYNLSNKMNFRCPNPPVLCEPQFQNSSSGQPILLNINNGTITSTYQQIRTNGTWSTASLLCGNSSSVSNAIILTNSLQTFSTSTLGIGANQSIFCWFNISSVGAGFQRSFNISIFNGGT